jgi:hypothetical protein
MEITKEQALWLLNDYNKIRQYGKVANHINAHVKAFSIIKGKEVPRPDCTCQYVAFAQLANSMYEQHLDYIQQVANTDERETRAVQASEEGSTTRSKRSTRTKTSS